MQHWIVNIALSMIYLSSVNIQNYWKVWIASTSVSHLVVFFIKSTQECFEMLMSTSELRMLICVEGSLKLTFNEKNNLRTPLYKSAFWILKYSFYLKQFDESMGLSNTTLNWKYCFIWWLICQV